MARAVNLRLPEELIARLDAQATKTRRTKTSIVVEALEGSLPNPVEAVLADAIDELQPTAAPDRLGPRKQVSATTAPKAPQAGDPVTPLQTKPYSCPGTSCTFQSISPAAKCPVHGRTVR